MLKLIASRQEGGGGAFMYGCIYVRVRLRMCAFTYVQVRGGAGVRSGRRAPVEAAWVPSWEVLSGFVVGVRGCSKALRAPLVAGGAALPQGGFRSDQGHEWLF